MTQRYPQPITAAMLTPANPNYDRPRYTGVGVATDWQGGAPGNEADMATSTTALKSAAASSAADAAVYAPRTQKAKGAAMVPPLVIVNDLGKDYGAYAGSAGRNGPVTPLAPYPDKTSPPIVLSITPNSGVAAGGTAVTLSGAGLTGATGATIGGTAVTSFIVVDANTITAVTPAKTAGAYDVIVNSPRGASAAGLKFTYA